jgi:hypothetical protein
MSRRLIQRRQLPRSMREQLIDEAFARYLDWRAESETVDAAYTLWTRASQAGRALPFAAYSAALDREERAASVYRSVMERIEQLFGGEDTVAPARPRAARA